MERVFVYGTLKQGHYNHRLLNNSSSHFLGTSLTDPEFTMLHLGGFPGVVRGGSTRVQGEVYSVTEEVFKQLDRLEGYPNLYTREKVDTDHGEAWLYLYNSSRREHHNEIKSGVWEQ